MDRQATMYQRYIAPHDRNGNGRRVFVLMNKVGDIVQTIDEGCSGRPKALAGLVELPEVRTTVAVYREMAKLYNIKCSLCQMPTNINTAHRHQGVWVGDECWDD